MTADRDLAYARLVAELHAIAAEPVVVPPGLAAATVARVLREAAPAPRMPCTWSWWLNDRRRIDVAVALGLGFLAFGLAISGVAKLRDRSQRLACQDNLRALHVAFDGYADTHNGRLPEVGTPEVPRAGDFATELVRGGQLASTFTAACPAGDAAPYAYTLGYRPTPLAAVTGLRRAEAEDFTPVAADRPSSVHGRGQNVLFLGGAVRFATLTTVGLNGDDIYRNDAGLVAAGLRPADATLGRPHDMP